MPLPPYPHPSPKAGSNAIGSFAIGVSPIGTISPFDVWATVISQYANSPIIASLCFNMAQYVDTTADFDKFFDTIWNVDTAVGVGLDVWGRIVGVNRVLELPVVGDFLGFDEASDWQPFGQAPFFSGQTVSNNFALADDAYRRLIIAKALFNICDGSIQAINQLLLTLFPNRGNCYVTDGLDMTMTYSFQFVLTPAEYAMVLNSGVLPRPCGVTATIVQGIPI